MKKIIVNEEQAKFLVDKIVSEQFLTDNRYSQEVKCSFNYHGLTWIEDPIEEVADTKFNVTFTIDIEAKSYGINGILVGNVRGPEEITADIIIFNEAIDDIDTYPDVTFKLNWDDVVVENDANIGWIGIDDDIEMDLVQVGNRVAVSRIVVHSKEI